MEEYITRTEFEHFKQEIKQQIEQRQTEEMKAINVNVGSQDVLDRLGKLDEKLDRIDKKQDEHAKGLFMHSKNISAFQTRFDKIESTMATKEDLKAMATKEDLKAMATKEDLKAMATKEDLKAMATKDELAKMKEDIIDAIRKYSQPGKN